MKLEQQVVSLEIAKKLKELGVKQESLFYYFPCNSGKILIDQKQNTRGWEDKDIFSAFTVAELGEMLPKCIMSWKGFRDTYKMEWVCNKQRTYFLAEWVKRDLGKIKKFEDEFFDEIEANARGKCLIYLVENELIEVSNAKENDKR